MFIDLFQKISGKTPKFNAPSLHLLTISEKNPKFNIAFQLFQFTTYQKYRRKPQYFLWFSIVIIHNPYKYRGQRPNFYFFWKEISGISFHVKGGGGEVKHFQNHNKCNFPWNNYCFEGFFWSEKAFSWDFWWIYQIFLTLFTPKQKKVRGCSKSNLFFCWLSLSSKHW